MATDGYYVAIGSRYLLMFSELLAVLKALKVKIEPWSIVRCMAMEYAPPARGTSPDDWTEDQQFEHEWVGETVFNDMSDDPECEGLSEEAFNELWQKYRDWYFWGGHKIPGHEHEYDW